MHRANVKGGLYMDGTRVHALNERLMKSVLYDHLKNILMLVPKLSGGRYLPDTICKLFGDPGGRSFKAAALANDPLNDEDKEAYAIRVSLCKEIDNWHECGFGVVWDKYRREAQGTNYLKGHQTLQPEQRQPAEAYDLNFTPLKVSRQVPFSKSNTKPRPLCDWKYYSEFEAGISRRLFLCLGELIDSKEYEYLEYEPDDNRFRRSGPKKPTGSS